MTQLLHYSTIPAIVISAVAITTLSQPKIALALDAVYYNNRGVAYRHQQEYQRAIADCNEAIQLDPRYAPAYSNRCVAYNHLKEYQRAIGDYNKAIQLDPQYAPTYGNRGVAYSYQNKYRKARKDFQKAADLFQQQGDAEGYQDMMNLIRELQ
jgi:tetratricopeptide (TPR) repeat protein